MIYLEEHREEDVNGARLLRDAGQELISSQDVELTASLLPKCDELDRMADALSGALERRSKVLRLSKDMHEQVLAANKWCRRGVQLLTTVPYDVSPSAAANALTTIDQYIAEGQSLKVNYFCFFCYTSHKLQRLLEIRARKLKSSANPQTNKDFSMGILKCYGLTDKIDKILSEDLNI
ncbi:unnamed protein product [Gongylonema pulchrum]|uniref:Protein-tyrosine-phosphatase n=1 Tax=Gongylonema pulchrum TaxID=637853 RepID=A0A183EHK8_9BILA|nr:unnamed protein product [Gongylonema pulchrum]